MKEVLQRLIELQDVDSQLRKIESVRGDLPQHVTRLEEELKTATDNVESQQQQLIDTQKERDQVELEIKELESKKKKYQDQLYEVKNNREYDAVTHEIDSVTTLVSDKESRVLELMGIEEELKEAVENAKSSIETLEDDLKTKKEALQQMLSNTEKEETALVQQRNGLLSGIEKRILGNYERIRKAKNGLAVAPVLNHGVCGGCFKNLPPQRVLEIREMQRLFLCESCGRMLVWDQDAYDKSS